MAATAPVSWLGTGRPAVPYGRRVELPGRGRTFVREIPGPPGAPTVLLLHGWVATGALNWFQVFEPLSQHFRVIAPDTRGHGRGLRTRDVFRLSDCADDYGVLIDEMGTGPVIAVGYSMGGPSAQLLWRRHRDLVSGLVLCATSAGFFPDRATRLSYQAAMFTMAGAARAAAVTGVFSALPMVPVPKGTLPLWAAREARRHDWRMVIEAGHSVGTFRSQRWIGEIDVPTSVVCTAADRAVPRDLQLGAADAIPGATVHYVDDGHMACANPAFADPVVRACLDVASRIG